MLKRIENVERDVPINIYVLDCIISLNNSWRTLNNSIFENCFMHSIISEIGTEISTVTEETDRFEEYFEIDKNVACYGQLEETDIIEEIKDQRLSESEEKEKDFVEEVIIDDRTALEYLYAIEKSMIRIKNIPLSLKI